MRVSWRINFFVPSLCVNDELSVVRNGGQQVCIVYCGREAKLSKGIVLLIICQTASHLQGMTGKQLWSVLLSAPSAPVKSAENSPCNFISGAQRILLVKWSDRSISFGVCSEMRVGLDCLFPDDFPTHCSAPLALPITHHFCLKANDAHFTDLAFTFAVIQTLLSSTGSSFSFHFIPHTWEFHFIFQVYLYVLLEIHIHIYFVISLTQMSVNAQMEFTHSSSLNFSPAYQRIRYCQLWLHPSLHGVYVEPLVQKTGNVLPRNGGNFSKLNLDCFQRIVCKCSLALPSIPAALAYLTNWNWAFPLRRAHPIVFGFVFSLWNVRIWGNRLLLLL